MKQRTIFRWLHILAAIPILGYIYSPYDKLPAFASYVRFGYFPLILLTGLWMWKGHAVLRLLRKTPVKQPPANNATETALANQL